MQYDSQLKDVQNEPAKSADIITKMENASKDFGEISEKIARAQATIIQSFSSEEQARYIKELMSVSTDVLLRMRHNPELKDLHEALEDKLLPAYAVEIKQASEQPLASEAYIQQLNLALPDLIKLRDLTGEIDALDKRIATGFNNLIESSRRSDYLDAALKAGEDHSALTRILYESHYGKDSNLETVFRGQVRGQKQAIDKKKGKVSDWYRIQLQIFLMKNPAVPAVLASDKNEADIHKELEKLYTKSPNFKQITKLLGPRAVSELLGNAPKNPANPESSEGRVNRSNILKFDPIAGELGPTDDVSEIEPDNLKVNTEPVDTSVVGEYTDYSKENDELQSYLANPKNLAELSVENTKDKAKPMKFGSVAQLLTGDPSNRGSNKSYDISKLFKFHSNTLIDILNDPKTTDAEANTLLERLPGQNDLIIAAYLSRFGDTRGPVSKFFGSEYSQDTYMPKPDQVSIVKLGLFMELYLSQTPPSLSSEGLRGKKSAKRELLRRAESLLKTVEGVGVYETEIERALSLFTDHLLALNGNNYIDAMFSLKRVSSQAIYSIGLRDLAEKAPDLKLNDEQYPMLSDGETVNKQSSCCSRA